MSQHFSSLARRKWASTLLLASSVLAGAGAMSSSPVNASGACTPGAPTSAESKVVFDSNFGLASLPTNTRMDSDIVEGLNGSVFMAVKSRDGVFGDFHEVYKYLPNGTIDTTWATNGMALLNLASDSETLDALISLSDGSLAALIHTFSNATGTIIKLNASGSRDNSFGSLGIATFSSGTTMGGLGLASGPSGSLFFGSLLGGQNKISKLNLDGTIDSSFGTNGEINVRSAKNFAVDSTGAIYVGSQSLGTGSTFPQGNNAAEISKFQANGLPDTTFGTSGVLQLETSTSTEYHGGLTLSNNSLTGMVYAGTTEFSASLAAVYRVSTSGVRSPTFGSSGIKTFSDVTGSSTDPTRPRARVFADGSTILSIPGLGMTNIAELTALAPNGDVVAGRFRLLAGDCNMRILVPLVTSSGIYVAARHQAVNNQPDTTPYLFKISITGLAAPATTTLPPATTVASTTPATVSPSANIAPTTTVTNTISIQTAAPALAVVRALPVAATPIVADNSITSGDKVAVTFKGFKPFEFVQLIVASTPRVIASGNANAQGVVILQGNLPSNLSSGSHTLAVFAPVSGIGFTQKITVAPASLPATGSDGQPELLVFAMLLFSVGVLLRRTTRTL